MNCKNEIRLAIKDSIALKMAILKDYGLQDRIERAAVCMSNCFKSDGKVLFCGNGGSASDAQHLAAELSGRFYRERKPLFAEALHVNSSFLTAVSNDYGFEMAYARMVEAAGRRGDVLLAISTSGNSENILRAAQQAKEQGMLVIGLTGKTGGKLAEMVDILLNVPSSDTPRIQEAHILIGHILCEWTEAAIGQ